LPSRKINNADWRAYCDAISKFLMGKRAEIEVAALSLGAQFEAEGLPLVGIAYDPNNNVIELALGDLDHIIAAPAELYVNEGPRGIDSLEIVDGDSVWHIIKLRDPLSLPSPTPAHS
jgi:hypothetical protein